MKGQGLELGQGEKEMVGAYGNGLITPSANVYAETVSSIEIITQDALKRCLEDRLGSALPSFIVEYRTYTTESLIPVLQQSGVKSKLTAINIIKQILATTTDGKVKVPVLIFNKADISSTQTGSFLKRTANSAISPSISTDWMVNLNKEYPMIVEGVRNVDFGKDKVEFFVNLTQAVVFALNRKPSEFGSRNNPSNNNKYSINITSDADKYTITMVKNGMTIVK